MRSLAGLSKSGNGFGGLGGRKPIGWWSFVTPSTGRKHVLIVPAVDREMIARRLDTIVEQVANGAEVTTLWTEGLRQTPAAVYDHFIARLLKEAAQPEFYAAAANPLFPGALEAALYARDEFEQTATAVQEPSFAQVVSQMSG